MRLIDRLLSRADGYNEYMYSGAYPVAAIGADGKSREGTEAGLVRHAREAYRDNGVVFACAAVRAALFAEARFKFQSLTDARLYGTPDLGILEHPWPNADSGELLSRMEQDGGTTAGNAFIRRVEPADGSDPLLVQMRPDTVVIVSQERTDAQGRTYKVPSGYAEDVRVLGADREPQVYTVDEVAHYSPVPDPGASFRGMSWLTPVLREVRADQAMTGYKITHLSNGAMPGMVVKYSRKLSDTTVETLRKRLSARYGGPENAGKTIVLDEGADLTVAGSTLEQLQFEALTRAGERRVCAAAGPGLDVILGFESGDYQAAVRRLADLWARPHWRMACAALQHLVPNVPAQGVRLWYDTSSISALREGELARGQTILVKSQAVSAFVAAGYTRDSAVLAAESGDLSQLKADPGAPVPGGSSTVTATTTDRLIDGRPPQAGVPQDLPGVVKPNLPNAKPWTAPPMPSLPNGARGLWR